MAVNLRQVIPSNQTLIIIKHILISISLISVPSSQMVLNPGVTRKGAIL